jgi:hypothetical protein
LYLKPPFLDLASYYATALSAGNNLSWPNQAKQAYGNQHRHYSVLGDDGRNTHQIPRKEKKSEPG